MTGPRDFEVISQCHVISGQLALPSRHLLPAELEQQAYDLSIVPPTDGLFQIRGVPRAANHAASSDVYLQAGRVGGRGLVARGLGSRRASLATARLRLRVSRSGEIRSGAAVLRQPAGRLLRSFRGRAALSARLRLL